MTRAQLADTTKKGEKEAAAFGKTRLELESKVLRLERSLEASRKELESRITRLDKTLAQERKSAQEVQVKQ